MGQKAMDGSIKDPCLDKIEPGEPFFVLRGQDQFAAQLVRTWAQLAAESGLKTVKVRDALRIADDMDAHPFHKIPD